MLARDTYLNSSCGRNRSLIFQIKNRWNASVIHYMAKPVIQNKEMAKFKTKKPFQSDTIWKTGCGGTYFYFVILLLSAKTIICPMKEKDFDFHLSMVQNFCSLTLSIFISNCSRRVNISIYSKTFAIKEFLENFSL